MKLWINIGASPKFQEFLDSLQKTAQKFMGQTYMFKNEPERSGYIFQEDITFKKGDQVDFTLWLGEQKNGKAKATIVISDFETAWKAKQERDERFFKNSQTNTVKKNDSDDPLDNL